MLEVLISEEWERCVNMESSIFHSSQFHDFHSPIFSSEVNDGFCGQPVIVAGKYGTTRIVFPFLKRSVPGAEGYFDITSVYGYGGPLVLGQSPETIPQEVITQFQAELSDFLTGEHIISEFTRIHPFLSSARFYSGLEATELTAVSGYSLPLNVPEESLRAALRSNWRNHLREAEKSSLVFNELPFTPANIHSFVLIYHKLLDRLKLEKKYYVNSDYFETLANKLGSHVTIISVTFEDKPISMALMLNDRNMAYYWLSCADYDFSQFRPYNLMAFQSALLAKKKGQLIFDLMGAGSNEGLQHFKSGIGRMEHKIYLAKRIVNQPAYNSLKGRLQHEGQVAPTFFPVYRAQK